MKKKLIQSTDNLENCYIKNHTQNIPCEDGWKYKDEITNSVISEWNLICEKDFLVTLALVLFGTSGLIGNYIFGYVQDGFGRKPAYYIYLLIGCIFGVATAFAENYVMWVIFRIGVGFTVPAILGTPYVLDLFYTYSKNRKFDIFFYRVNKKQVPKDLIANFRTQRTHQKINCKSKIRYGIKDLFRSKNLRWKTIIITFLWFTNTSVYVGLSYYAPTLGGDEYLNFFLAGAVELPTYLFLWPAMERLGRRWTLCISMIIGGTSCLATFLVQNDYVTTLALYCVGKMGISSSFVVLPLMASELYPTVVRGLGMSLSSVIGMLGPIFIPLVNYLVSKAIFTLYFLFLCLSFENINFNNIEDHYNYIKESIHSAAKEALGYYEKKNKNTPYWWDEEIDTAIKQKKQKYEQYLSATTDTNWSDYKNHQAKGSDILILPLIIMGTMLIMGGTSSLLLPETLNQHLPQTLQDAETTPLDCFAFCNIPQKSEKHVSVFESKM
ncbi:unnamed protein product [Diabrotica balteata]|uniref:Organic cation transporter 1 n=1 Tax=Diabrotica balteata TaxID=107213 RepID=A0A9N9XHA2_DIABA|nr:unnamed protein product [Diabrotica balteata]